MDNTNLVYRKDLFIGCRFSWVYKRFGTKYLLYKQKKRLSSD